MAIIDFNWIKKYLNFWHWKKKKKKKKYQMALKEERKK